MADQEHQARIDVPLLQRIPRRLLWLAGATFAMYSSVLLLHTYGTQQQLQLAAESQLQAGLRHSARVMGDFVADQRNFARDLAESHEVAVFLMNQALGMSERYGLGANLHAIEERFRRKVAQERVLGAAIYSRILYVDEYGIVLVDTGKGTPAPSVPDLPLDVPAAFFDVPRAQMIVAARVHHRGAPGGRVVAVADASLLLAYLEPSVEQLGVRQLLVDAGGREISGTEETQSLPLARYAALPANELRRLDQRSDRSARSNASYDLALRTPVPGTDLSIVTLLPASLVYGHTGSKLFILFAVGVPLVVIAVAMRVAYLQRRTKKLEADVLESRRDRSELQGLNASLTEEIARRESLERELRESEERYRTYIEHAPEGIFVADATGRYVDVNPSACAMVGYSRAELLSMKVTGLSPDGHEAAHAALLDKVLTHEADRVEIRLQRKDRSQFDADLRAIRLPGNLIMGFCVDITERKSAEEQIRHLAYFDPLTALPNRRLLMDRLKVAMIGSERSGHYCALLILDLDHFKDLNDTQGHDIGDRLLVQVARRVTETVRREDTVARLGGDEFVVLVEALGANEAEAAMQAEVIAEKVHDALAVPYALQDDWAPHHSTPSIGVALFCGTNVSEENLLKQADVALYQAKEAGRNAIRFFNPQMQAAIDARAKMESALRRGIKHEELRLYFQPQVDANGSTVGAEALLRWLPPGADTVLPARFITLAEETGLILPIGAWVLEQACEQLRQWRQHPATQHLVLSVNVSARQFHQSDFAQQVTDLIKSHGIEPSRLVLELTESTVLARVEEAIARMNTLKRLGVAFSLDDFGTGYSSLSYLKRLPLNEVKIDQSFVRDITHDPNDMAIVRAILAMSQSLGLSVIAEGVETEEQRDMLAAYGCGRYQGYLFGAPVPIESFANRFGAVVREEAAISADFSS